MAKSPEEMAAAMIANMKGKTGKSLTEWLKIARKSKLAKHGEIVNLLKADHGMTHGYANLVAIKTLEGCETSDGETTDGEKTQSGADLVDAQFSAGKKQLRPLYEKIVKTVGKFGPDVEVSPKKAYVSLRPNKQFAIVKPSTKDRLDVGINLKGVKAAARLEASGSFNNMVSHRVRVTKAADIDGELAGWLRQAYESS